MKILIKLRKTLLLLLILTGTLYSNGQQDPMYTQYMNNLQTINPAYAGSWESIGFLALSRYQWVGFTGKPSTQTFSFQTPLKTRNVGVGFDLVIDKLGPERRTMVNLDYSYRIKLKDVDSGNESDNTYLRFGLKGGFTNYSNDLLVLTPFPGGESDPVLQGVIENKFVTNVGIGMFLYSPKKYYLSISVPRLVQNKIDENTGQFTKLSEVRQYYFVGGITFPLSDNLLFKPAFMTKAAVGSPMQFDISTNFLLFNKFWIGGMYRSGDALGLSAQWIIDSRLRIGYTTDFTLSELKHYHQGVHEIMIQYEIKFTKRKFTSPRYF